jgi:anaerobic selenocysteine-containing dehydrogenase
VSLAREDFVEINPKDAQDHGIEDGKIVNVVSRNGGIETVSRVTDAVRLGFNLHPHCDVYVMLLC